MDYSVTLPIDLDVSEMLWKKNRHFKSGLGLRFLTELTPNQIFREVEQFSSVYWPDIAEEGQFYYLDFRAEWQGDDHILVKANKYYNAPDQTNPKAGGIIILDLKLAGRGSKTEVAVYYYDELPFAKSLTYHLAALPVETNVMGGEWSKAATAGKDDQQGEAEKGQGNNNPVGPQLLTEGKIQLLIKHREEAIKRDRCVPGFTGACKAIGMDNRTVKAAAPELVSKWPDTDYLPKPYEFDGGNW